MNEPSPSRDEKEPSGRLARGQTALTYTCIYPYAYLSISVGVTSRYDILYLRRQR